MINKLRDFLIAGFAILVATAICFPLSQAIGYQTVGLIFLMIVAVLSLFLGRTVLIFAAFLNFIVWNFFFIPPLFTFRVHSAQDVITLFANLIVAIVGSTLISRIRKSQKTLKASQERLTILYGLLESLNNASSIKEVVKKSREELKKNFDADAIVFLKEKNEETLARRAFGNIDLMNEQEYSKARRIFINHSIEERFRKLNDFSHAIHYFPLIEPRGIIGVIGILFNSSKLPDPEKLILLRSFLVQIASSLDREISIDQAKDKEIFHESEKLFQTVLNSVSHELRTPISIISAAVSNLNDDKTSAKPENRLQICTELNSALKRLNLLVENILDMSRIESGHLKLNLQYCDLSDLIGFVVQDLKSELTGHPYRITTEENLPLIKADITLLKQALINVLHNASIYTSPGVPIFIMAYQLEPMHVILEVTDHGKGIAEANLTRIFDKFYRVPGTQSGGTGLGLTITKAIVDAHQGRISAENIQPSGLKISMSFNTI